MLDKDRVVNIYLNKEQQTENLIYQPHRPTKDVFICLVCIVWLLCKLINYPSCLKFGKEVADKDKHELLGTSPNQRRKIQKVLLLTK